ncbi:G-D-S-L family lipolytic protein [Nocardia otitidiscaviarum]|uniref:G-D-S-L family lipolytic protein n=1 Tax=Nocardia otitidiscaviarum TaxID=1823 RepID=A0A516NUT3_9NOCA|nr:G-D-S-L family lipolytic protein [Nocardia otitidiscaviarum]
MLEDLRVCFVGESFVAGVGDQRCLGWAGRLAVRAIAAGQPLTYYNLGVRRETSTQLRARWLTECEPRLPTGCDGRLVLSTGVNDTMHEHGRPRVPLDESVANLAVVLEVARAREWPVLVVAPPPIADAAHTDRIAALDERFAAHCDAVGVPYVRAHQPLRDNRVWMAEVAAGDGAHPGAAGYDEFAELLAPHWLRWLTDPGS